MAYKVKIVGIDGKDALTADGKRLRIIGSAVPRGYAYTDGVVVYGYSLPDYVPPFIPRKKPVGPCPFFTFGTMFAPTDAFRSEDVFAYHFDTDGVQQNIKYLWDTTPVEWTWDAHGVTFANTADRAFVRKDDSSQGATRYSYIDDEGNTFIPTYTDACVFGIDKDGHFKAQTGDYRRIQRDTTVSWWDGLGVHAQDVTSIYDWTGLWKPLRGTEHDLSYETDDTARKSGNVTAILDSVFSYIVSDLGNRQGTPPSVPTAPPSPALLDMAIYQDSSFCFRDDNSGPDAYGDRRMEFCGDAPPVLWLLVSAVAYGGTHTESGRTGWWPVIYRYKLGVQCRDGFTGFDIVFWNVETADFVDGVSLGNLVFRQAEHAETGYKVSFNGYEWKNGTLTKGDRTVATIPTRPFGVCEVGKEVHVLTAGKYYIIVGQTVTTRNIHTDNIGDAYIYSDNGSLCPIDSVKRVADAYMQAYY